MDSNNPIKSIYHLSVVRVLPAGLDLSAHQTNMPARLRTPIISAVIGVYVLQVVQLRDTIAFAIRVGNPMELIQHAQWTLMSAKQHIRLVQFSHWYRVSMFPETFTVAVVLLAILEMVITVWILMNVWQTMAAAVQCLKFNASIQWWGLIALKKKFLIIY